MNNDDFKLYVLAQMEYESIHSDIEEEELFPLIWYDSNNYRLKTQIIAKAIKENKLVTDLEDFDRLFEV